MADAALERAKCPRTSLTAAYLDGELDPAACEEFDAHARVCADCAAALLEQRRLLCLLDTAFDQTTPIRFFPDITRGWTWGRGGRETRYPGGNGLVTN